MNNRTILTTVLCLWGYFCLSQDTLILEEAIKIGLENNYAIRIAKRSAAIAKNNQSIGTAGMLPSVDLKASQNFSKNDTYLKLADIDGTEIKTPGARSDALNASVELSWTLFDGFNMFITYNKLKVLKEIGQIDAQLSIETTISQIIAVYYDIVQQKKNLEAARNAVSISELRLLRAETKAEFGGATSIEVLRAKVDLNTDKSSFLQQKLSLSNAKRKLNQLLARDINTDLEVVSTIDLPAMPSLEELKDQAMNQNSSIFKQIKNKLLSELDYKLVRASKYPRISLSSSYALSATNSEGGFITTNQNIGPGVGLTGSFNIFNGFNRRTKKQNAIISMSISELQYQELKSQLDLEITNAWWTYQNRMELLQLEKENLQTAQINMDRSTDLYHLGQLTSIEYRQAQMNYIQTQKRLINAQYLAKLSETDILRLSGKLLR